MNGSDTVEDAITVIDAAGHYSVYVCLYDGTRSDNDYVC